LSKSAQQLVQTDILLGVTDVPVKRVALEAHPVLGSAHLVRPSQPELSLFPAPIQAPPTTALREADRDVQMGDKNQRLDALRQRHDSECQYCTAARGHLATVFGEGNPDADIFFVGEAPGESEEQSGRPFAGRAGQKLDEMIRAIGLRREDCYLANVLKSRTPDNRTPLPNEIERCGPYLVQQLLIVSPKVIVTLGGPATKLLLNVESGITKLRGVWAEWIAPAGSGQAPIALMPTYHPSYLLRNYTVQTRGEVWADLKAVAQRITQSTQSTPSTPSTNS